MKFGLIYLMELLAVMVQILLKLHLMGHNWYKLSYTSNKYKYTLFGADF